MYIADVVVVGSVHPPAILACVRDVHELLHLVCTRARQPVLPLPVTSVETSLTVELRGGLD